MLFFDKLSDYPYGIDDDYALNGVEPDITTLGRLGQMCWTSLKPNIHAGYMRFANGCKGGAPSGNQNARKTTENQPKNNLKTSNTFIDEDVDVKGKDIGVIRDKVATKCVAFVAPTLEEVIDFFATIKGTRTDAERFSITSRQTGGKRPKAR